MHDNKCGSDLNVIQKNQGRWPFIVINVPVVDLLILLIGRMEPRIVKLTKDHTRLNIAN